MLNQNEKAITEVKLVLPRLHPMQQEIFDPKIRPKSRFTVGSCGTKFGKSFGAAVMIAKYAWTHPGSTTWWVAPTLRQCKVGWNELIEMIPQSRRHLHKTDAIIELRDLEGKVHSMISFRSAENPDWLRGDKVNLVLIDECARVSDAAFHSVFTTLTRTRGDGYFISTPKGNTLFRELHKKGQFDSPTYDPEFWSFSAPTSANPYVPRESIETARKLLPADVFKQEYLAEFIGDSAGVFTNVNRCIDGSAFSEPERGHYYVLGADLAKHTDYTVLTVIDRETHKVVYWERFNELPWPEQKYKIVQIARKYNKAKTIIDATRGSYGDSILDDLKNTGQFPIEGYEISTAKAKAELIKGLILAISDCTITFPEIQQLIYELKTFEYKITPGGTLTYAAPKGYHDDCVISLALAVWGLKQSNFIYYHKSVRGV